MKLLEEEGVEFERVNYFVTPLTKERLNDLLGRANLTARDVLRTREKAYVEMGLADDSLSESTLLDALVSEPSLLQRPIVERGDRVVLGRPLENVRTLFSGG